MTINWKIKLLNKQSSYLGSSTGTILDDLDKIAEKLGVSKDKCFDLIQHIRIIKVDVRGLGAVDGVKFTYLVEIKDKNIEIEGYQHGGTGGQEAIWDFKDNWWLLNIKGTYGKQGDKTIVRRLDFWGWNINNNSSWADGKGSKADGDSNFELFTSACFFSRTVDNPWGGGTKILGAIGCYWGEITEGNLAKSQSDLKTWTDVFGTKTASQVKNDLDTANANQEKHTDYDQIKGDLATKTSELKTANNATTSLTTEKTKLETELKAWTDVFGDKKPSEVKTEYDNLKEQHTADQLEKPKPEDSKISDQKKGPFLTYLHTRPVFSKLYKEIKKLGSIFNVDLLYVTDDKNEFLKNLSEHRFNFLLWESKDGYWSVLWTHYRERYAYYTDTDVELEVDQEAAQIKKFFKGESFENQFFHWGPGNSAEGKTKQGFAAVAIETILKRIKDDPKLVISEEIGESDLKLLENSADIAQKEYDVYLEQLNQKIAQVQVATK